MYIDNRGPDEIPSNTKQWNTRKDSTEAAEFFRDTTAYRRIRQELGTTARIQLIKIIDDKVEIVKSVTFCPANLDEFLKKFKDKLVMTEMEFAEIALEWS